MTRSWRSTADGLPTGKPEVIPRANRSGSFSICWIVLSKSCPFQTRWRLLNSKMIVDQAAINAGWRLGARLLVDLGAWWFSLQDGDDLARCVSILFQPIGGFSQSFSCIFFGFIFSGVRLHGGK